MKHISAKIIAIAAVSFVALSIALLWAWNALAELAGAPSAEYRHVIAALLIAISAGLA